MFRAPPIALNRLLATALIAFGLASASSGQMVVSLLPRTVAGGNITYVVAASNTNSGCDYHGQVTFRIGPGDTVAVIDLQVDAVATWNAVVPYPPSTGVPVSITTFAFRHATPGAGVSVPATRDANGNLSFFTTDVPGVLVGTASFTAPQLACNRILTVGGVCSGSFDLAAAGTRMLWVQGVVPASGTGTASVSIIGNAPFSTANPTWGYVTAQAVWTGELTGGGTTCVADFNGVGGVTVQDIFDYLSAWFAGDPRADVSGGGVGVQDIFDFLALWFVGC